MKLAITALLACCLAFGQSATPTSYPTGIFNNWLTMEAQAVPTSPTVITTRSLIFGGGWISCSSTRTITMTDGNGKDILPAVSQTVASYWDLKILAGSYISGGFSLSASGSGCNYHAFWRQ